MNKRVMTLDEFTIQELRNYPGATGQLSGLLRDIGLASKRVNVEVNKAGIADILGEAGKTNVQGESVKKLDESAKCVPAPPKSLSRLPKGVSNASKATEPTTVKDIVL